MKLILPHREVVLSSELSYQERNSFIEVILQEKIEFHEMTMTVEEYFRYTWNKQVSRISMDIIGYYLSKGSNEREDGEILSHKKEKEMKKGSDRHVTFSGLSAKSQEDLGITDPNVD